MVQSVRIQSQKLEAGHPYALRGALMKTGQSVLVEQVRADESRPSSAVGEGLVDALGAGGI